MPVQNQTMDVYRLDPDAERSKFRDRLVSKDESFVKLNTGRVSGRVIYRDHELDVHIGKWLTAKEVSTGRTIHTDGHVQINLRQAVKVGIADIRKGDRIKTGGKAYKVVSVEPTAIQYGKPRYLKVYFQSILESDAVILETRETSESTEMKRMEYG